MTIFSRGVAILLVGCGGMAAQGKLDLPTIDSSTPRNQQVALALSAAPPEVSRSATVYILGKRGYEKVLDGDNGFTCTIDRELITTVEPECFDAEGTRTIFQTRLRTEELRAAGKSETEIKADIEAGYQSGKFHAPSKPGIVYMLSDHNRVFDPSSNRIISFPGHLMFYAPFATARDLGYKSEASLPYLVHPGKPDALMIVIPQSQTAHH